MFLNETQEEVRSTTRSFVNDVVRPAAESLDREERFPAEIYDEMGKLGLFGIAVPEELGGPGFDTLTYAVVMEELSRGYASVADQCGLVELISTLLVRHTDLPRQLERAQGRIFGFHLCDWLAHTTDFLLDRGMMGDGVADLKGLRGVVETAGYSGFCEVEIFSAQNWWKRDPNDVLDIMVERFRTVC